MSKVRIALRSKSKNDDHAKRIELVEKVKSYASRDKYTDPEKYFERKLKKLKGSEEIAKAFGVELTD